MAAQAMRRPQVGSRYIWATVVVLVIIGLFASIVGLVLHYEPYKEELEGQDGLNKNIETYLYEGLRKEGIEDLPKTAQTGDSKTPWKADFFQKLQEHAKFGKKYQDFVRVAGYLPEEKAIEVMEGVIASAKDVSPRPNSVKEYVERLQSTNAINLNTIEKMKETQAGTEKQLADMTRLRDQLQNIVGKKVAEGEEKLRQTRERMMEDYGKLQEANNQLSTELERVRKERNELDKTLAATRDKNDTEQKQLREQVSRLEDALEKKFPKRKEEVKGVVRQADMLRKFAIVGIGSREEVKLGDTLEIYRIGRGGVTIKKATGKVVSVEEMVSRVDLFDLDLEHPVIEGDTVVPLKKGKEAAASAAPAAS
ncbi:MAG: hypothetical protein GX616_15605, partial [Planctomycetes bacterium]|nr:hypothetical protein [Planctomycetota bacterium]